MIYNKEKEKKKKLKWDHSCVEVIHGTYTDKNIFNELTKM